MNQHNNRCIEAYDFILDQGIFKALELANKIDLRRAASNSHTTASQIDQIVLGLVKNAQGVGDDDPNASGAVFPQNNYAPGSATQQAYSTPISQNPNLASGGELAGAGVAAAAAAGGRLQAWVRAWRKAQNIKLYKFQQLLNADPIGNRAELVDILKTVPKDLDPSITKMVPGLAPTNSIRSKFIQAIQNSTKAGPGAKTALIHDAAGAFAESNAKTGIIGGLKNKITGGGGWSHPVLDSFEQAGYITPQEAKLMGNMNVNQITNKLSQIAQSDPNRAGLASDWVSHIRSPQALAASEKVIAESSPSNVSKIGKIIAAVGTKYPWIKPLAEIGGKALGILAVAFEAKGVFDDFDRYGADGKTICDFFSVVAGTAAMIGALIPAAGEVIGPVAGAAWSVLSIGCMFVHHGEPLKADPKEQKRSVQDISSLTEEQLDERAATISFNQLSPKDQSTAAGLFKENQSNVDNLNTVFMSAAHSGVFDQPLDVLAALRKKMRDGNVFPGSQPLKSTPPETGQIVSGSFNLRKYLTA